MISNCSLNSLLADVHDADTCIIAAEGDECALRREADIGYRNTFRTHLHLLDYAAVGYLGECNLAVVLSASCQNHVVVRPCDCTDLPTRVRLVNDRDWNTIVYFVYYNL